MSGSNKAAYFLGLTKGSASEPRRLLELFWKGLNDGNGLGACSRFIY